MWSAVSLYQYFPELIGIDVPLTNTRSRAGTASLSTLKQQMKVISITEAFSQEAAEPVKTEK